MLVGQAGNEAGPPVIPVELGQYRAKVDHRIVVRHRIGSLR
jgi:hypothetical protein